ncbi:zf-C2H2 Zinc finger, C2H2 type [Scheffersomyces stipitis CBS 6054]|uniref:Zf-C2H2 Zinc finger, C2H2 type n=1 Tax=Scheffersomyces stipitis (strain ATCC 58785 / CBS 6054 / NBRC 10063 / NRRL Y-11545) TaxID=322104 RepID=A3LXD0_PICST|nr:zf-C2H2 Zinc finger, C2H2 type [Scheffersomyces stipitis CBS 6054]ABN67784.2 zf-C2H2 Zinc finger, C2H2 type [Scheffersomyces stipitis CBS 6054]
MTSIAVFPPLKRSITDIMDEELYHIPNSPIQFSSRNATQPQTQTQQNQNQSQLFSGFKSINSSPALAHNTLFIHNAVNGSSSSLNASTTDSFLDQYVYSNNLNATSSINSSTNVSTANANSNHGSNVNTNPANFDAMDVDEAFNTPSLFVSPFTDYGNPDSSLLTNNQINPFSFAFPARPTRRRHITTLDDDSSLRSSTKKEDDYLLFNPDIQPSHLINNKSFFNDDYLFVPNIANLAANGIIPGYENDYLLVDDFDEEIEADLSDDEEDDDNYFHFDDDLDDLVMNSNEYPEDNININVNLMDMDDYLKNTSSTNNNPAETIRLNKNDVMNGGYIDVKQDKIAQSHEISSHEIDHEDDIDELELEDEEFDDRRHSTKSFAHKSAAEISANNPNHQCDLINPLTGVPCNKQFSRPYDLIRHQETIHASKKKIFRCVICEGRANGGPGNGKSKTFSRGDALSRHIKVKHGLVGKEAIDIINAAKENVEYVSV